MSRLLTMTGYLIDPQARTIEPVTVTPGTETGIAETIGCDLFTVVEMGDPDNGANDSIFVDDEGLMKPQGFFFKVKGFDQPFAGKGLVLGTNPEGESVAPYLGIEAYRADVSFVTAADLGFAPDSAAMDQTDAFDPVILFGDDAKAYFSGESSIADILAAKAIERTIVGIVNVLRANEDALPMIRDMVEHADLYREALRRYDEARAFDIATDAEIEAVFSGILR